MKIALVAGALALVAMCAGCAGIAWAPVIPPAGLLVTVQSAPLDIDLDKTDLGTKTGRSSTICILGLVAVGDASTQAAAKSAGIKTLKHADYKMLNILGAFSRYTTIVYGD